MDTSVLLLVHTPAGCRMKLRVRAGARRDEIVGVHGEALKIAVSAPPERGRANRAVLDLLAARLDLPPSRLRLVAGKTSPDKTVLFEGMQGAEVMRRLTASTRSAR